MNNTSSLPTIVPRASYRALRDRRRELLAQIADHRAALGLQLGGGEWKQDVPDAERQRLAHLLRKHPARVQADLADLEEQLGLLAEDLAVARAERNHERRVEDRARAEARRPAHRAACRRIADALLELVEALAAEREAREGIPPGLLPDMSLFVLGSDPAKTGSPLHEWFARARRHNLLDD